MQSITLTNKRKNSSHPERPYRSFYW